MTRAEFTARFPHASESVIRLNCSDYIRRTTAPIPPSPRDPPSPAIVERREPHEPLAPDPTQARDPGSYVVRVTNFSVRLLDEDNLCEKFHVDSLRYAGLIPTDAPDRCRIITTQKKVARKADERTEIVIEARPRRSSK